MRVVELTAKNLALTLAVVGFCLILAYVAAMIVGDVMYGEGVQAPGGGMYGVSERRLLNAALRQSYVTVAFWVGLSVSQVVFVVWHMERRPNGRDEAKQPIGAI